MLQERTLGVEAIEYIYSCLAKGKTFASYLSTLNLKKGRVITFLPIEVSEEVAKQFELGGKLPVPPPKAHISFTSEDGSKWRMAPKPNINLCLVEIIQKFLTKGQEHICIFEDALAKPSDPYMVSSTVPWLAFNDEVYYFLSWRDTDSRKIEQVIKEASNVYPPTIGAMISVPDSREFTFEERKITIDQLKILAERTEKIIIGAYDGEGYLIWSKP